MFQISFLAFQWLCLLDCELPQLNKTSDNIILLPMGHCFEYMNGHKNEAFCGKILVNKQIFVF